jgi:acetyl-CoA carboxylase carboxyl transferase subunit beta
MGWFTRTKAPKIKTKEIDTNRFPDGLWIKCLSCQEIMYREEIDSNLKVCPKCGYHFRISAISYIELIGDQGSFSEYDVNIRASDPLEFVDTKPYKDRINVTCKKLNLNEAIRCGEIKIDSNPVQIGVFEFSFMGGSMGSVVGEKITRVFEKAIEKNTPAIIVSASGGARMQEGIYSLMQMSKTCAALSRLKEKGLPYISILLDPTSGGVAASFSMLGDINITEPGALICFAGPRVIKETIKEDLPPGFQKSEFLLEHGMVDMIVERSKMRHTLIKIINHLVN